MCPWAWELLSRMNNKQNGSQIEALFLLTDLVIEFLDAITLSILNVLLFEKS